jgi:SAM-dependent methyltransferase
LPADLRRTKQSFDQEWTHHRLGDPTWYVELGFRVQATFVRPLRMDANQLRDAVLLDVGCGNGSQSVAVAEHVAHVIAVDLSDGIQLGRALRGTRPPEQARKVHFVQADLHRLPLPPASVDIIHAYGVLHHTPDTRAAFTALVPLLRCGGTLLVWLYREQFVPPRLRRLRRLSARLSPATLDHLARLGAPGLVLAARVLSALRLRSYPRLDRRAMVLTIIDLLGPPYMHYHTVPEVIQWFTDAGFTDVWSDNHSRVGFTVCGRLPT